MTSANVSKMTEIMSFQTNATAKGKKQEEEAADFMGIISNLAVNYSDSRQNQEMPEVKVESNSDSATAYEKYPAKEERIPTSSEQIEPEQVEEAQQAFEEFTDEVQKQVEEIYDVSEEEIEQILEDMGITMMELMEPANLAEFVTRLTGEEDGLQLLLSEGFQELKGSLEELSTEFLEKLGMSKEKAMDFMSKIQQQLSEIQQQVNLTDDTLVEQPQIIVEGEQPTVNMEQIPTDEEAHSANTLNQTAVNTADDMVDTPDVDSIHKDVVQESTKVTEQDGDVQQSVQTQVEDDGQQNMNQSTEQDGSKQDFTKELFGKQDLSNVNNVQASRIVQTVQTVEPVVTPQPTANIQVIDLIQQVSEFTRVMYQGDVTSMELQLNPENLGKLYVQVSSKDGAITAQIAAQNEAVKEVLENQLVMLKENMTQQGLKVEAVEVTVASHEFERNLEQNQDNQQNQEQSDSTQTRARRNINLNNLDELSGLMSEEEMLVAKMMQEQGNSVNYTA